MWFGAIGLHVARLVPYAPLQPTTIALLAATIACLAGVSAASAWWLARHKTDLSRTSLVGTPAIWVTVLSLVGLGGFAWYIREVVRALGWEGFANAELLRFTLFTYRIPSTFLFAQLAAIAAPLTALALRLGAAPLPRWALVLPILCVVSTVISTDRTQFFTIVLTSLFMVAHRYGAVASTKRVVFGAILAGALLIGSFLGVEAWRAMPDRPGVFLQLPGMSWVPGQGAVGPGTSGGLSVIGRASQRLAGVYIYSTGSFSALDRLLVAPPPATGGKHTFFPILRPLQRAGLLTIDLPSPIPGYVQLYDAPAPGLVALSFNAYTFLYYPLCDFGIAGALVYTAIVALILGIAYAWARADRSDPFRLLVIGQASTALALSIFVNKFNNTATWYILAVSTLPWTMAIVLRRVRGTRAG